MSEVQNSDNGEKINRRGFFKRLLPLAGAGAVVGGTTGFLVSKVEVAKRKAGQPSSFPIPETISDNQAIARNTIAGSAFGVLMSPVAKGIIERAKARTAAEDEWYEKTVGRDDKKSEPPSR